MKGAHVGKVGFEAAQVRQVLSKLEQGHPPSSSAEHLFESVGRPHPGLVLDINSLTESFAEGESCGSCLPPPEAPIMQTVPTVFTTVNLCQDGDEEDLIANKG